MIGSLIGAGVGLVGSVVGGITAANRRRKADRQLNRMINDNESWYNANALSDYTQRADSQNLLRQLREGLQRGSKINNATAKVTGATPEVIALQKEASGKVISDTLTNLGAMGQRWKDNITSQYLSRKDALQGQKLQNQYGSAQAAENVQQSGLNLLSGSLGNIVNSASEQDGIFGSLFKKRTQEPAVTA